MKRLMSIIFMIVCAWMGTQPVKAQKLEKKKWYKAWVYSQGTERIAKGYLYQVSDSSIILTETVTDLNTLNEIAIEDIHRIHLRRNGNIARGFGIGFLAGFSLGVLPTIIDPSGEGEVKGVRLFYGTLVGVPAAFVGGLVGVVSGKSIILNKQGENYLQHKSKLKKYAYVN